MSTSASHDFFRSVTATYRRQTYPFIDPFRPELSTEGKTALVSGAGQGIGASIAKSLAKSGISALAILGRTEQTLLRTKAAIEKLSDSTRIFIYALDITDLNGVTSAFDDFVAQTGTKVDILVANAGYLADLTSIVDANPEDWWSGFEINVKGNFNLLRCYVPHAAKDGVVVHVGTSATHIPYMPGYSSYRGSKMGATKVFEIFGKEMHELSNGVRVVQVHPGLIRTAMSDKFVDNIKGFEFDDVELSGDFVNWCVSKEASFLDGKFVWANWDAEELMEMKGKIEQDVHIYTMNLIGWR
ncbi:hypothetical protein BJ170DRAFT_73747 [Xylariales sp. AK1849]|nr:hypothetical protein BJ170DRAFT_73747 [Xylariales sp. AK1849]